MTLKFQTLFMALIATVFLLASPDAKACRDCPFPMKIGERQWLMPDSRTVVVIEEVQVGNMLSMTVFLMDSQSGALLAKGSVMRPMGQRSISLVLIDRYGRKFMGDITWVSYRDSVIQARFDYEDIGY
jgi:hypothetical protein